MDATKDLMAYCINGRATTAEANPPHGRAEQGEKGVKRCQKGVRHLSFGRKEKGVSDRMGSWAG